MPITIVSYHTSENWNDGILPGSASWILISEPDDRPALPTWWCLLAGTLGLMLSTPLKALPRGLSNCAAVEVDASSGLSEARYPAKDGGSLSLFLPDRSSHTLELVLTPLYQSQWRH